MGLPRSTTFPRYLITVAEDWVDLQLGNRCGWLRMQATKPPFCKRRKWVRRFIGDWAMSPLA
jgi:hypothetical protein